MKRFIAFLLLAMLSLWLVACAIKSPSAPDLSKTEKHEEQGTGSNPPRPP